jgi:hypothetical protein
VNDLWLFIAIWVLVAAESVVAMGLILVVYIRYGRPAPGGLKLDVSQTIPAGLPPAVVGLLWRHGRVTEDLMVATLLDLVRRSVVHMCAEASLVQEPRPENAFLPQGQTFRLTLRRDRLPELRPFELEVVRLLFDELGGAVDSITVDQYRAAARSRAAMFSVWLHEWQRTVRRCPEAGGMLRVEAVRGQWLLARILKLQACLAVLTLAACVPALVSFAFGWWAILQCPGTTRHGSALMVRCRALRRSLRTTRIAEMPPPGLVIWDEYFVMAVTFGLARKTIADMYVQTPGLMQRMGLEISTRQLMHPGDEGYDDAMARADDAAHGGRGWSREFQEDLLAALTLGTSDSVKVLDRP